MSIVFPLLILLSPLLIIPTKLLPSRCTSTNYGKCFIIPFQNIYKDEKNRTLISLKMNMPRPTTTWLRRVHNGIPSGIKTCEGTPTTILSLNPTLVKGKFELVSVILICKVPIKLN